MRQVSGVAVVLRGAVLPVVAPPPFDQFGVGGDGSAVRQGSGVRVVLRGAVLLRYAVMWGAVLRRPPPHVDPPRLLVVWG